MTFPSKIHCHVSFICELQARLLVVAIISIHFSKMDIYILANRNGQQQVSFASYGTFIICSHSTSRMY